MKLNIRAPHISRQMASNTGLFPMSKIIKRLPDRRMVVVNDRTEITETSMVLCFGQIVPAEAETKPVAREEIQDIVVKLSPDPSNDAILSSERKILTQIGDLTGLPQVLDSGLVKAQRQYHSWRVRAALPPHFGLTKSTDPEKTPYFVMPKIPGQDLFKFSLPELEFKANTREQIALLTTSILPALAERLAAVHARGFIHRDIKPNNAIYDQDGDLLTLLDFGRANWLQARPRDDVGTFGFYPPEFYFDIARREDVRTDTFGLGISCFTLLTGRSGLMFEGMEDPWSYSGLDLLAISREYVMQTYYEALIDKANLSPQEMLTRSNMPADLRETQLGQYIGQLSHPGIQWRPYHMGQIAQELRRLGGQLLEHELSS